MLVYPTGCSYSRTCPDGVLSTGCSPSETDCSSVSPLWAKSPARKPAPGGGLHGLQGDNFCHHGLLHRLQRNLCSGAWSPSSPSFFADPGVYTVVSFTYFTSFSSYTVFLPFLKYVVTELLPLLLIGSALASSRSFLEMAGIGSVRHGGQLLASSDRSHLQPPWCHNLAM